MSHFSLVKYFVCNDQTFETEKKRKNGLLYDFCKLGWQVICFKFFHVIKIRFFACILYKRKNENILCLFLISKYPDTYFSTVYYFVTQNLCNLLLFCTKKYIFSKISTYSVTEK